MARSQRAKRRRDKTLAHSKEKEFNLKRLSDAGPDISLLQLRRGCVPPAKFILMF
jgi:hypothetical protein